MNLERFCKGRLIVLSGEATAYDAARAMFGNHIGAVLVAEHGELAGIATDRDLLIRAGSRLSLDDIPLREVMTPNPVGVDVGASLAAACAVMLARHVRRVVVLDEGRPCGIVTLDDLVLASGVSREQLRKIVSAQLTELAPAKPEGLVRPMRVRRPSFAAQRRRDAHRAQTLRAFTAKLRRITGLRREPDALAAFEVVASNLIRRLTPDEAGDFAAQLPAAVREKVVDHGEVPDRRVSRGGIERQVAQRLGIDAGWATEVVWRIGQHLAELVSEGEVEDLAAQLPGDLKRLVHRAA